MFAWLKCVVERLVGRAVLGVVVRVSVKGIRVTISYAAGEG